MEAQGEVQVWSRAGGMGKTWLRALTRHCGGVHPGLVLHGWLWDGGWKERGVGEQTGAACACRGQPLARRGG
jgi:hypothetical protein